MASPLRNIRDGMNQTSRKSGSGLGPDLIVINCSSNSTLQDIKIAPTSGVYSYNDSDDLNSALSNRLIIWRAYDDILHLSEQSLNRDLHHNEIQIQFKNSLILHNGVTIHEAVDKVVLLVTTIVSAHRIVFPHPNKLILNPSSICSLPCLERSMSTSKDSSLYSIFYKASLDDSNTNFVQLQNSFSQNAILASPAMLPYLASCSWVDANLDAYFVLSTASGSLNIIRLPSSPHSDSQSEIKIQNVDLKQSNLIGKFFDGIRRSSGVPSIASRTVVANEAAIGLLHYDTPDDDNMIFALCRDNRIRVYSLQQQSFLLIHNLFNQSADPTSSGDSLKYKSPTSAFQKAVSMKFWSYENEIYGRNLVVYTTCKNQNRFHFYQAKISNLSSPQKGQKSFSSPPKPHLRFLFQRIIPSQCELMDYFIHDNRLWAMWQHTETISLQYYSIDSNLEAEQPFEWMPVISDLNAHPEIGLRSPLINPREYYINEIFWKGNFSIQTISKALSVLNHNLDDKTINTMKIDLLIQEAIQRIDNVIRNQTENQMEMNVDEYIQLEVEAWSKLFQFCLDYHVNENEPMSIFVDSNTGVKGIIRKSRVEFIPSLNPFDDLINHYFSFCKLNHAVAHTERQNGDVLSFRSESPSAENDLFSISAFEYRLNVLMQTIQDPIHQSSGFISTMENMRSSVLALLHGMSAINVALQDQDLLDFEAFMQRMSNYSSKAKLSLADITKKITEDVFLPEMSSFSDFSFLPLIDDFFEKCPYVLEAIKFFLLQIILDYMPKNEGNEDLQMNNDLQLLLLSNNEGDQLKMHGALKFEINSAFTNILSSRCGLEFAVTSISRVFQMRYKFCRDLFLFQYMLTSFHSKVKSDYKSKIIQEVQAYMIPATCQLLFALNYQNWTCEAPMITPNIWWSIAHSRDDFTSIVNLKTSPSAMTGIRGSSFETFELLSVLEMHDYINLNRVGILSHESIFYDAYPHANILYYFIQFSGGIMAKRLLSYNMACESEQGSTSKSVVFGSGIWSSLFPLYMKSICQLLWPFSSGQFKLAEFLMGVGQFHLLESYVNMLQPWCTMFSYSHYFAKGVCYLMTGEGEKAIVQFEKSFLGVASEPFLMRIFAQKNRLDKVKDSQIGNDGENLICLPSPTNENGYSKNFEIISGLFLNPRTIYRFYNRLIQLFNRYSTPDHVIELAECALQSLSKYNNPEREKHHSALQSILFACHLRLGNIEQAYKSMINNLDPDEKQNCLRQFIMNLCEAKKFEQLVSYPYIGMEDTFVSILESKAKSSCVRKNTGGVEHKYQSLSDPKAAKRASFEPGTAPTNYYYVLYSFFMNTVNYRKAAQALYDYYGQLSQDLTGNEQMLKIQANALLIARNCLKCLDDPKYSWIVKNTTKSENGRHQLKRKYADSFNKPQDYKQDKAIIEIVDMDELLLEYELISARLKLLERNRKEYAIAATPLSAEEIVILCTSANLYEQAFRISELFGLPYEPIFEGMASQLVQLLKGSQNCRRILNEMMALTAESTLDDPQSMETRLKLSADRENCIIELFDMFYDNTASNTDCDYINYSLLPICDRMWHLIFYFLYRYELNPRVSTRLFKIVAEKLLSNGVMIPISFKKVYQKSNCPELIRLLMGYDFLAEATHLSIAYMKAFMGFGFECFDLSIHLYPNCPPLCIPLHIFDCLADFLQKEIQSDKKIKFNSTSAWPSWPPGDANSLAAADDETIQPKENYDSLLQDLNETRQKLNLTIKLVSQI